MQYDQGRGSNQQYNYRRGFHDGVEYERERILDLLKNQNLEPLPSWNLYVYYTEIIISEEE